VEWKEHSEGFAGLEKAHVEDAFWMTSYSTETDWASNRKQKVLAIERLWCPGLRLKTFGVASDFDACQSAVT
jgi:hypothetical protein